VSALHTRHCREQTERLSDEQATALLGELSDWHITDDSLQKLYKFKNYYATMAFANLVAWVAHRENHHPDMHVSYNKCKVIYSTHSVGGLSENDFICAARLDAALSE